MDSDLGLVRPIPDRVMSGSGVLAGKVAIVTGAGRGIGRAIAEQYALEGAKVVVASRTSSTVDEVVAGIRSAGGDALPLVCDVGEVDQIRSMVDKTVAAYGTIDILVNNAQSFGTKAAPMGHSVPTLLQDVDEAEWDWVFETGVKATLRAMQAVFPVMLANGGGRIINFGSRRGIMCNPDSVSYNSNKEAIRALSRTAANAWGQHGINVNVINPVIETDSARGVFADYPGTRERTEQQIPMRRWGQPIDCARVAVFLAGPDASYLTGMTMIVEGGMTTLP
jgi:NAD(P)-dependent dehydrogenase (short-subunit alcohol dehydrogenase family)